MKEQKERPLLEIHNAGESGYYFVFKLPGQAVFISNFFEDTPELYSAIDEMKNNVADDAHYLRKESPLNPGQVYFLFQLKEKHFLGQSTMYNITSVMESGIDYMKENILETETVMLST